MRTALTILIIVALALVAVGAVNHAVTLDLDFLALGLTDVSVFWLTLAFAGIVIAAGVAAAWAARGAATAAQRRLEKELGKTYKRLREAQAGDLTAAVDVAVVGATVTALAPPPPEAAALDDAGAAGEPGLAEVTAVTAVVAPVAEEWGAGEALTADDAPEAADVPAEVVAVVLAAGREDDTPGTSRDEPASGEDETVVAVELLDEDETVVAVELLHEDETVVAVELLHEHDAGHAAEVTAVTMVVPVVGDAGLDRPEGGEVAAAGGTGAQQPDVAASQPAADAGAEAADGGAGVDDGVAGVGDTSEAGTDGPPQVP